MRKGRLSLLLLAKKNLRFIAIPEEYNFLGAFLNCEELLIDSSCLSVCLSIRPSFSIEQKKMNEYVA
jgi:hypothetical protein